MEALHLRHSWTGAELDHSLPREQIQVGGHIWRGIGLHTSYLWCPPGFGPGPILFLIYINDLPDEVCSQVRLLAGDTPLYLTIEREDDSSTLKNDLDKLETWENRWGIEFKPSKCQVVKETGSRRPLRTIYTLHGQVLEAVVCAKYLGVDISGSLS